MKLIKTINIIFLVLILSVCQVFLGPNPDNSPRGIFDRIWTDFNETYALFDVRGIDWNEVYDEYSPKIYNSMSDYDLFRVCSQMLNILNDPHVTLLTPFGISDFYKYGNIDYLDLIDIRDPLFNIDAHEYLLDSVKSAAGGMLMYGRFITNENVGYIYIAGFLNGSGAGIDLVQDWVKEIDNIIMSLQDTDSLVLDIRNNIGGAGSNMNYIASRFVSVQKNYIISCTKNGPAPNDFSAPVIWPVKPAGTRYTKPIVLITNEMTISAGEWFTAALRTQSHVTHTGKPTCGALSARTIRPLINGWKYSISVQKVTDMDGNSFEGKGISPNKEHIVDFPDQLEYARDLAVELAGIR
jgi:C-terminal processing protease CtpA/Prc